MAASLTRQVRLGFSLGWRIWTPNEVGFYAKTLAHSYFILMILTSKFLKQKIWIVNYTIIMGVTKYFIFVEFLKFGLRTKEERSYWKKIIYITLVIRHKKYSAASVKSVKKKYYNTRSKIKRYEQMLMLSNRSFQKKQGFFDDQYSFSSEKNTQKNFDKKNIKFFKTFNEVIKNIKVQKKLNNSDLNKKSIKLNYSNLIKFWKKINLFNKILKKSNKKNNTDSPFGSNLNNKKIKISKTSKLYKFLNIFLINNGGEMLSKLRLAYRNNKKKLLKNESEINKKKNVLGPINSEKLFFLLKKNFKKDMAFSNEKKNIVNLLNFQKINTLDVTKIKINDFLYQKNKIKVMKSRCTKNTIKNDVFVCKTLKRKKSKSKIFRRVNFKINKKNKKLIKKILIKSKLFLNSIFFKLPRKFSIAGGPRKRLSRNLRRAFKSNSVQKIVNLIWFWEKISRLVSLVVNSLRLQKKGF